MANGKAGRPSKLNSIDVVKFGNLYNQWIHKFITKGKFAAELGVTVQTLETHMEQLYLKLQMMIQSGEVEWVYPQNIDKNDRNTEDN